MLYTLNLDDNNYVLSIGNSFEDNIELDLTDIDLDHIGAYQYKNNKLFLDKKKLAKMIAEDEARLQEDDKPTWQETIEAQVTYTAMMTDTLIEG